MNWHLLQRHNPAIYIAHSQIMKRSSALFSVGIQMNTAKWIIYKRFNGMKQTCWLNESFSVFVYWRFLFVCLSLFFVSCHYVFFFVTMSLCSSFHLSWIIFSVLQIVSQVVIFVLLMLRQPPAIDIFLLFFDYYGITFILSDRSHQTVFKLHVILSICLNFVRLFVFIMCNQRTFNKHDLIIVVEKQILVSEIKIIMDVVAHKSVKKITSF